MAKRQVRSSVYETNSSSTHSIAIPIHAQKINHVDFEIGEFGWDWEEVSPADYLYTAIYEVSASMEEAKEKIDEIKKILDENGVTYHFGRVNTHIWHDEYSGNDYLSLDNGYIDHGYELEEFVAKLINDGDKLMRFLSGGLVFTGNDNSSTKKRCFIERDQLHLESYDWNTGTMYQIPNPYYMPDHANYEWYYKGN